MIPSYFKIEYLAKVDLRVQLGGKGLTEPSLIILLKAHTQSDDLNSLSDRWRSKSAFRSTRSRPALL